MLSIHGESQEQMDMRQMRVHGKTVIFPVLKIRDFHVYGKEVDYFLYFILPLGSIAYGNILENYLQLLQI